MLHSINYCMCVSLKFICIYFFLYYRGPCVRKLFTGLIMYLPSQNKEHCIVLYWASACKLALSPNKDFSFKEIDCISFPFISTFLWLVRFNLANVFELHKFLNATWTLISPLQIYHRRKRAQTGMLKLLIYKKPVCPALVLL